MVHTFKIGGQRIAYDSVSGLVLPLSELAYKMLDYIELPMSKECSSALRYDLAKYDSAAISGTYDELYKLYQSGKLFAEGTEADAMYGGAAVKLGDVVCTKENSDILAQAMALADNGENVMVSIVRAPEVTRGFTDEDIPMVVKAFEKLAREQVKRARGEAEGKPFAAFEDYEAAVHDEDACASCWACKLCALDTPHSTLCELEKKRVECVMICKTAQEK